MATHSSILAWEIPWTEEPGELQFMGMQRIRNNWACTHQKECPHPKFASLSENLITKGVNKHWPNSYLLQSIRTLIALNTSSSQAFYYKKSYMEVFKTHCWFFRNRQEQKLCSFKFLNCLLNCIKLDTNKWLLVVKLMSCFFSFSVAFRKIFWSPVFGIGEELVLVPSEVVFIMVTMLRFEHSIMKCTLC